MGDFKNLEFSGLKVRALGIGSIFIYMDFRNLEWSILLTIILLLLSHKIFFNLSIFPKKVK